MYGAYAVPRYAAKRSDRVGGLSDEVWHYLLGKQLEGVGSILPGDARCAKSETEVRDAKRIKTTDQVNALIRRTNQEAVDGQLLIGHFSLFAAEEWMAPVHEGRLVQLEDGFSANSDSRRMGGSTEHFP